jgi:protein TonB
MFDALVITKTEKRGFRTFASLPVAAAFHAALVGTYYVYMLYAPVAIRAPLAILRFSEPAPISIPVRVVPRDQVNQMNEHAKDAGKPVPTEVRTPFEVPTEIKPADPPTSSTTTPDSQDPGFIAVGDLPPGATAIDSAISAPRAVQEYQLSKAVEVLSQVQPEYPAALRAMGVEGRAVIKVTIGPDGQVEGAEIVTATNPLFGQSALDAVRRWRFTKSLDDAGSPLRVIKIITVNFALR